MVIQGRRRLGPGCAIGLILSLMTASACDRSGDVTSAKPSKPGARSGGDKDASIRFETKGGPVDITVEVARYAEEIQRGLMYRRSMPETHGMVFLMGSQRIQSFWMRNTYIPLDMIFVDENYTIAGIVENTEPLTDTSRRIDKPSKYVIEVNGGFTNKRGIRAGDKVVFIGIPEGPTRGR